MMINAYQEMYLNKVMSTMGDIFDSAVYEYGMDGSKFVIYFVNSTACKRIESGEITYILGKSGTEIVYDILFEITGKEPVLHRKAQYGRTVEYWCGWALSYYQWKTNRKYMEIFNSISFEEMESLYPTLHEADVTKTAEIISARILERNQMTRLKKYRTAYGCSQRELAEKSGVSLRSIQMYEQRQKDINKAQVITLFALAKTLGCQMEDLLEATF